MMMNDIKQYLAQHYAIEPNQWAEDGYGQVSWSYVIGENGKVAFRTNTKGEMDVCWRNEVYPIDTLTDLNRFFE